MKKSVVVTITALAVVFVILGGILISGLCGGNIFGIPFVITTNNDYQLNKSYEIDTKDINKLDINWTSGAVEICASNSDKIVLEEYSHTELKDNQRLKYSVENKTLKVTNGNSGFQFLFFNFGSADKKLTLTVPSSCLEQLEQLKVDATSADISMDTTKLSEDENTRLFTAENAKVSLNSVSGNITVVQRVESKSFNAGTTSGDIKVENCSFQSAKLGSVSGNLNLSLGTQTANSVEMGTTSGNIEFNGGVSQQLKTNSVSGNITANLKAVPDSIAGNTTSGYITLALPTDKGFTIKHNSTSGNFNSNLALERDDNTYIFINGSNGGSNIELTTISGNVTVNKAE